MKLHLLAIDCQWDFCDPKGALSVPGAADDINRLSDMVNAMGHKIDQIHVTLDSHNEIDIAHPIFWVDSNGKHPDPFTIISVDDVLSGKWNVTNLACRKRASDYVEALYANGKYPLCIWPPHCIIGTVGCTIQPPFDEALKNWSRTRFKKPDYQVKGSNPFTEHYSVFRADVVDPSDHSTMLNTGLINLINSADEILIAGEARSHCVRNSIVDLIDEIGHENAMKFVILEDAMSDVPTFEAYGESFMDDMKKIGMRIAKTTDYI